MKRLFRFVRTTLVGGILFLVPIIVLVAIIGKALALVGKLVDPLAEHLPVHSVLGLRTPILLAIALVILVCFLAGFYARTVLARKSINWLETTVLSNLPGYEFIKGTLSSTVGAQPEHHYDVVLARFDDSWQMGFRIEVLADGFAAVFIPGAPNPQSGSVYYMTEDRIKAVNIPPAAAMKCLRRLGTGSNTLLGSQLSPAGQSGAATGVTEEPGQKT